jgi:hypothetical protein
MAIGTYGQETFLTDIDDFSDIDPLHGDASKYTDFFPDAYCISVREGSGF